ncbi:MAG: hypothetical protein ACI8VT_000060 [Saprospiraceae bacterium]|jgi:hypothetical protein
MLNKKYGFRSLIKYRFFKQNLLQEFHRWRKNAPGRNFYDYYVEMESRALGKENEHPSLGNKIRNEDFKESGLGVFKDLLRWGLQPHHICVDYGCGSLRIGQHVIAELHPGHYFGLDVTDHFFHIGKQLLSQKLLQQKEPQLSLINNKILKDIADQGVDYIFSSGVLLHVPPFELADYFHKILSLLGPTTKLYIGMTAYKENIQFSHLSWAYTTTYIQEQLLNQDADLKIEFLDFSDFSKPTILGKLIIQRGTVFVSKGKKRIMEAL